jgi:cation diffusion facilitator family transporter
VGVLSEGIHSFLDVISASLTFFTVQEAVKPADEDHPYGHGKIETLSSLFESLLLVAAAGFIFFEAIDHFIHPQPVHHQSFAIGVMIFSILLSYCVYLHNQKVAINTESRALHVNALHFLSDVIASIGILAGLILLKLTGWSPIDPIIAFAVATYILLVSAKQVKEALLELCDTQLPQHEIQTLKSLLSSFEEKMIEAHDLRTRKSGINRHIDFHMVVCGHMTVDRSHSVCDEIENRIQDIFPESSVNIHVEPCEKERAQCPKTCRVVQSRSENHLNPGNRQAYRI